MKNGRPKCKDVFTPGEQKIIDRLILGYSNKEIAGRLGLQEKTIKHHLTSIYRKFSVTKDREFLAKYLSR